jgi:hypothetical protein
VWRAADCVSASVGETLDVPEGALQADPPIRATSARAERTRFIRAPIGDGASGLSRRREPLPDAEECSPLDFPRTRTERTLPWDDALTRERDPAGVFRVV